MKSNNTGGALKPLLKRRRGWMLNYALTAGCILLAGFRLTAEDEAVGGSIPGVVYLKGSDYEIGFKRASLNADEFRIWSGRAHSLFSRPEGPALRLALEFRLTEVGERLPGLLQEWRGMADAVCISYEDMATGMIGEKALRKIAQLPVAVSAEAPSILEACSAFGMTHSDRGPILGKTSDSHGTPSSTRVWTDEDVEIIDYTDGYRVLMCGWAILNDQGLAVGDANAHYLDTTSTGIGRGGDLVPIIARYCPDVDSAVAFLENYEITDDGRHFCFVDKSGKAAAVEKGPGDLINISWGDSTGYVYVTNTSADSTMKTQDTNDSAYVANSDHRWANLERMFSDTAFQFTFEGAESIIFSHDTLGAICQHGDSIEVQWHTTRSRLLLPAEGKYYLAARPEIGTSYHPCEHVWREYEFTPLALERGIATALPEQPALRQNHPNPFNAQTTISYQLPENAVVELAIYDLRGQRVRMLAGGMRSGGEHRQVWDGQDDSGRPVPSGVYYYRLEAGDRILTKKMILMK
ncbi:MAG: T9SS type A sorting domain-containing protein [Fidelibacterota bacterium]|nr:MAG: T9SS type A sorting domain-containing protein [Candidatus Neomarinimicrobiota bacterium]